MTIEIKQLVIRATAERPSPSAAPDAAERRERTDRANTPLHPYDSAARESLIADCVRLVLRELRKARGR